MRYWGVRLSTWGLLISLAWICVECGGTKPQYMVAVPVVLEAGAETKFCASLLNPNETLVMRVTLMSPETNTILFTHTARERFHICTQFQAPLAQNEEVHMFKVEVRGSTFYSEDIRKVMIKTYEPLTFLQTDKPIYLPGQTVYFRIFTLDTHLKPASLMYNLIEIKDPSNNRIRQWLNETSNYKLLQHSYPLTSEAREGLYKIIVLVGEKKTYYSFKVKKYVLPKFAVNLNAPKHVSISQEEFKTEVCATYTYGQPVPGNVEITVCRSLRKHVKKSLDITVPCYEETKKTDKKGCATFTLMMSIFTKISQKVVEDNLNVDVKVTEEGTDVSFSKSSNAEISYILGKLVFINTTNIYEPGSIIEGKVKATHFNDTPIAHMLVYLHEGQPRWPTELLQNLTTDTDGTAAFNYSTASNNGDIHLYVTNTPKPEPVLPRTAMFHSGAHILSMFQTSSPETKSISSLEVKKRDQPFSCDSEHNISIHYAVVGEKPGSIDIMYLVLSNKLIFLHGYQKAEVKEKTVTEGKVTFPLRVSAGMAPGFQVVAYTILPSEKVIAHRDNFSTEKCFSHRVSLAFSPPLAVPGEDVTMHMSALPGSMCGLSAVDQSVLTMDSSNLLNEDKVFNLLSARKSVFVSQEVQDPVPCLTLRAKRSPLPNLATDSVKVFQDAGLKMATNLVIAKPECLMYRGEEYLIKRRFGFQPRFGYSSRTPLRRVMQWKAFRPGMAANFVNGMESQAEANPIETVRTFFPETWIWDLVEVGGSGEKDVPLTVPDTITTWETEAFCLSSEGFGLAPRQKITVFQPFFLELTMPYSIISGEQFELKATTFNYLPSCIMITVTPAISTQYNLTVHADDQHSFCLCASERKTVRWNLIPSSLGVVNVTVSAEAVGSQTTCDNEIVTVPERGRIDLVTKSLIVKAEGTEIVKVYNYLICPKGHSLTETTEMSLPENAINGSAQATVSVLGDILGRAMNNLDGLLRMPYGCGEQNMALLAPNIYILQYLEGTKQLTTNRREKATNFLSSGYQNQLNYRHRDGGYSTFGSGAGNTWLTAFVLRSFATAQSFIYIDPLQIEASRAWLELKQKEDGCFQLLGKLFNNRLKGGVSDEVTLSAYITAAFLEMNSSVNGSVVKKSLSCLQESLKDLGNTYTTALLAYVFTLAGDMETRNGLLQHLDKVAIKQGGFIHWSQKATETTASLSVEISSYVLLAKLSGSPTVEDLGYSAGIVRWLTGQQNSYGGYSSTQDTVAALQALALYSTLVFSPGGASAVTVTSPSEQLLFDINQDNKLLYQEKMLQDVVGKFSVEVKGSACASVQLSVQYNIPTPTETNTLSVEVNTEVDASKPQRPKVTLKIKSLYSGKENTTNMVILDIKVLSGFVPNPESLKRLKGALLVDRVDHKDDHVLVYLRELSQEIPIHHTLELLQKVPVQNLKPAVVKIYDYYQPSDQAETEYTYT